MTKAVAAPRLEELRPLIGLSEGQGSRSNRDELRLNNPGTVNEEAEGK